MPASHLSVGLTPRPLTIVIGLIVAALAAVSVAPAQVRAAEHAVTITDDAFGPATLTVGVGDTVTWTNSDDSPHTVTDEGGAFDSGNMDTGATFAFTFTEPGTYTYRCDYHSEMQGTIVVEAMAETPAAPSTAPASAAPSTDASHAGAAHGGEQPDTALPVSSAVPIAPLLIGLGLVALAFGLIPARAAAAPSRGRLQRSGWRR